MDNREYIPSITCVNKVDLIDPGYKETVGEELRQRDLDPEEVTFISAEEEKGLDVLKDRIWERLGLIRVSTWRNPAAASTGRSRSSSSGEQPSARPSRNGGEMEERFRFAPGHRPQRGPRSTAGREDHVLEDEDVLKLILRR